MFQLINISKSINSKKSLIKKLIDLNPKEKEILSNQEAIKELKNNPEFILNYLKIIEDTKNIEETDYENNLKLLNQDKHVSKKELIFGIITAVITDIILFLGIINIIDIRFFFLMLIIQLLISYIYLFKYGEEFENISKCGRLFTDYNPIYPLITNTMGSYTSDEERDAAMTYISGHDIAFIRNHTELSGTAQNILRRFLL